MTIEQRLERVIEIGGRIGKTTSDLDSAIWLDQMSISIQPLAVAFEKIHYPPNEEGLTELLALWMEFNEIVEELELTILGLGGVIQCLAKPTIINEKGYNESTNKPQN